MICFIFFRNFVLDVFIFLDLSFNANVLSKTAGQLWHCAGVARPTLKPNCSCSKLMLLNIKYVLIGCDCVTQILFDPQNLFIQEKMSQNRVTKTRL